MGMFGPKPSPETDRFVYDDGDLVIEHVGDKPAPTGEEEDPKVKVEQEPGEPPTIHIYE